MVGIMTQSMGSMPLAQWVSFETSTDVCTTELQHYFAAVFLGCALVCAIISVTQQNLRVGIEQRSVSQRPVSSAGRFFWLLECPGCCVGWYWARFTHAVALYSGESMPNIDAYLILGPIPLMPIVWLALVGPTFSFDSIVQGAPASGLLWGMTWLLCLTGLRAAFYGAVGCLKPLQTPLAWLLRDHTGRKAVVGVGMVAILLVPQLSGFPKVVPFLFASG